MRNSSETLCVPLQPFDADATAAAIESMIAERAERLDASGAFPDEDVTLLAERGLVEAVLPARFGGIDLGLRGETVAAALAVLVTLGRASLPVGRLFEGHLNAVRLVDRFGSGSTMAIIRDEVAEERLSAVWNAEQDGGVVATPRPGGWTLSGRKRYCSGAGSVRRPIVTARPMGTGASMMLLPDMTLPGVSVGLDSWCPSGMRATVSGTVDFDGLFVPEDAVVGAAGDYYRSPHYAGGAWRVLAVQLGGLDRMLELHAAALLDRQRDDDPVMRARLGSALGAQEAARLLVHALAERVETDKADPASVDAYADLCRAAFEEQCLVCIEATRRNIGLSAFLSTGPLDRVIRDLETYLRQPALDRSRDRAAAWALQPSGGNA